MLRLKNKGFFKFVAGQWDITTGFKTTKLTTSTVSYENAYCPKTKYNVLIFELHGNRWDLSMGRKSYKLTERTKKVLRTLKNNYTINFETIHYKLTALSNVIHLILT